MEVRLEDVSPVEKKMIVNVPWPQVKTRLNAAYRELGKGAVMKGFRKGKVPQNMLEMMYGKQVRAEVAWELLRESFLNATEEHKLEAVAEPVVKEKLVIKKNQDFEFEAIVEVKGEVTVETFEGLELTKRKPIVSDESIDSQLKRMQDEHTDLVPIEGRETTDKSDVLTLEYSGKIGETELPKSEIQIDLSLENGGGLPGLVERLIGISVTASELPIEFQVDAEHQDKDIAGKDVALVISVKDAKTKQIPNLDDEFAKDTGKADTLDDLKALIHADLLAHAKEHAESDLKKDAIKALVEKNPIPVASSLVERTIQYKVQRINSMLGIPPEDAMKFVTDEMRENMKAEALEEVRSQLLLEALSKQENIEVTDEELMAKVGEMAKQRGEKPAMFKVQMEREGHMDSIRFSLEQDKVTELLIEKAIITEEEGEDPCNH